MEAEVADVERRAMVGVCVGLGAWLIGESWVIIRRARRHAVGSYEP